MCSYANIKKTGPRACFFKTSNKLKNYYFDSVIAMLYTTSPNPILLIASAMLYHRSTLVEAHPKDVFNQPPSIHM